MAGSADSKVPALQAPAAQPLRTGNSSDLDSEVQSNKPLFLNFTAELAPFSASKKQKKKSNVYKVSGVNILNRNSVDSKTALERLQRRRENHNFVERRRRDNINHTITSLSTLIPYCSEEGVKLNKGSILHMAVEYIQDLQAINASLAEENVRLGGSGNIPLPPRRLASSSRSANDDNSNSAANSQDENEDEDEDEDMPLAQSTTASPNAKPADSTPAGRAPSSGDPSPNSKKARGKGKGKGKPKQNSTHISTAAMSPPITTAEPSAAPSVAPSTVPSAATSPMALSAVVSGQNKAIPPVPQLPPTSAAFQNQHQPGLVPPPASAAAQGIAPSYNLQQQQQQPSSGNSTATFVPSTTPILPPIASTTSSSSSRPSPPLITPKGHAALLPVPQIQPQPQPQPPSQFHLQLPHSGLHLARKPPAQSMPNSPSFQAASGGRIGDFLLGQKTQGSSTFGTHPFFNSNPGTAANSVLTPTSTHDIPSIRHHLHSGTNDGYSLPVASQQQQQLNNGSGYQQQQQNAAGMPIRKSSLNSPQYRQHPYGSTNGRPIPVAQSLQNTPLMRPNRESSLGEGIELPPISFGSRTVLPPPQQPPVLSLPPPLQHQQHQQQH